MIEFLIAADDRTGALETAGACADVGMRSVVATFAGSSGDEDTRCLVVDMASRHLDPTGAGAVAAAMDTRAAAFRAHKIDSTLRGNWAHELVARHRAGGRRVLVVPAFPAVGRMCTGGVVFADGHPVSEGPAALDALAPVRSSRPSEHLRVAGAPDAVEITDAEALRAWLDGEGAPFAVGDASADSDLERVAALWLTHPDILLAGTAATIGAAAGAIAGAGALLVDRRRPVVEVPVLVVCGSLHPGARAQVAVLVAAGAHLAPVTEDPGITVARLRAGHNVTVASDVTGGAPVDPNDAVSTARVLAAFVSRVQTAIRIPTMILIGGDTAAAVLGDDPLVVGGTVAPGVAWCRPMGDEGPLVLAKPGGFGAPSALHDLLAAKMAP